MVAEVSASQPKTTPRFSPGNRIPESIRLTVRSLYVVQGVQVAQIANTLGLKPQQVRNLVVREGWTKLRDKKGPRKQELEAKLLARAQDDINRVVEATAILSEDLSLRSLNLCGEYLDAKDAKSLQMASGAARNLVQIARMSRGMDQRNGPQNSSGDAVPQTLIFVGALERAVKPEPRQVTEVSAVPVPPALPAS